MTKTDIYTKLCEKMSVPPQAKHVPQILERLVTPEEGEMLLVLPATAREIARKFHMDETTAKSELDLFVRKGVAMSFSKDGDLTYFFVRSLGQFHDASNAGAYNRLYDPVPPDLLALWERYRETDLFELAKVRDKMPGLRFRVIPLKGAIKSGIEILPYEDTEAIVRNAQAIAVVNCPCAMYQVTAGLSDKPLEVCMQLTEGSAKYAEEQGVGRRLSLEEAMEKLRITENYGLVPTVMGGEKLGFICHCDKQCCSNIRHVAKTGYHLVEKSRFQSAVNRDICTGCGICEKSCPFEAIEMIEDGAFVNTEKCYGCGVCVMKCPVEDAVVLNVVRPKEHIPLVELKHAQI